MPNDDYDDEFDDRDGGNESGTLAEARKRERQKDKQIRELTEQLNKLQKSTRERSVKDVLKDKGLPEKIAALIPESATTSEDVEAWITEYGDVFGVQAKSEAVAPKEQTVEQAIFDVNAAAQARISGAQATGQPLSGDPDQLLALVKGAGSVEDLNMLLFGNKSGPPVS